jgi:bifunctional non-homologous end joining protein LigD
MKPMLCRTLDVRDVERYLADDNWVAAQKLDGDRLLICVDDGKVTALNREGRPRSNPVPRLVLRQFEGIRGQWCFDGELLTGGELWLFDLPKAMDRVGPQHPFSFRFGVLERLFAGSTWERDPCIRLLSVARTTAAKRALFEQLQERGAEGLVFRHVDGPYRPGKRSDLMLKCKFEQTADVVVWKVRPDGRNNFTFRVFRDGELRLAGSCSLEGKPAVRPGDVVEVKYLYASDDHLLYQPRMLRVRDDKSPSECTADQFHYTDRTVVPVTRYVRQRRRSRALGVEVTVYDAAHPDSVFSADDGGRWITMCEHGLFVQHDTLKLARHHAPAPDGWCGTCQEIAEAKGVAS